MTAAVCSGVADGMKWRVVGDPNCPSVHPAAATPSATKDCRWVPKGHPMVPAGSPQCAAYQKQLDAILFHSSGPARPAAPSDPAIIGVVGIVAVFVVIFLLAWGLNRLVEFVKYRALRQNETVRADIATSRAIEAEAQVKRLAAQVKQLEGQLQAAGAAASAAENRAAAAGSHNAGPQEAGGSFAKLKALVVRELHPDGNPQAGALERTMRAELFKSLWPEIERLEKDR